MAIIAEHEGVVKNIEKKELLNIIEVQYGDKNTRRYETYNFELRVQLGDHVKPGQKITEGAIDLKELLRVSDITETQQYILKEVQKIYSSQGISISDKHVEIVLRQMLG
jgi:DNA-directed RNA polymerase subunit beta'